MSEWQRGTLGELAKGYRGVTYSAGQLREFRAHDTVTLLRSNNISDGQFNFRDVQVVSERLVSDDQLLKLGDIGVCMSNGSKALVGKSAQLAATGDERFTVGAFCSVFRPQPSADSRFVAYVFQSRSYRSNLDLALAGTAINNLRNVDVEAFACDIPPYEEQSRIAQVLDTLDTAIRETEALIDKLKAVKQGLLHDLLTRGIDANGQLRPPQSEAPQLYKESPLGWIPREWDISTVGDEFEIKLGKMLDAQKNSGVLKPYLGNKAVQWDCIDLNEVQQVALSISDMERFQLKFGDLLVCEGGDVGRAAIWESQLDECYYQKALHRLRPINGFSPRLMLELLRYWMGRDMLFEYISRTSIAHFTQEKFSSVPLPVPSPEEQDRLISAVLAHTQRLVLEENTMKKLIEKKRGLMDDLLIGRVRVTPLLDSMQQPAAPTRA